MKDAVKAIADVISEGFKLIRQHMDTAESRKMKKCIEAGEKYIQVNEKTGEFENINDKKQKKKLYYYKKRFFTLNN